MPAGKTSPQRSAPTFVEKPLPTVCGNPASNTNFVNFDGLATEPNFDLGIYRFAWRPAGPPNPPQRRVPCQSPGIISVGAISLR